MSHMVFTALLAPALMVAAGIGLSVTDALVVGQFTDFTETIAAALARVPALWAVAGIGVLLYGWARRLALIAWGVFALVAIIFLFGDLLRLPDQAMNVSPIRHVTHLPASDQSWLSHRRSVRYRFGDRNDRYCVVRTPRPRHRLIFRALYE